MNIPLLLSMMIMVYISVWFLLTYLESEEKEVKRKKGRLPSVSVVIPAYNEEKNIGRTIKSVLDQDYKGKIEIIVVDDGSTDSTSKVASSFRGVKVYRKKNGGKASALNYGIRRSRYNLVLALDSDCVIEKSFLRKSVNALKDDVMAVVPSIEVFRPKNFLEKIQAVEYKLMNFFRKVLSSTDCLSVAPAAVLYRKEFFKKHGLFDESSLTEDFEIGLRIVSKGFRVLKLEKCKVLTKVPEKISSLLRQRIRWCFGTVRETVKYRKIIDPSYGDLGVFVLPNQLLTMMITFLIGFPAITSMVSLLAG